MSEAEKEYKRIRMRVRRERLTVAGLCIDCGEEPKKETARRCIKCAKKINLWRRKRQRCSAGREELGEVGLSLPFSAVTAETGLTPQQISEVMGGATFNEIGIALGISKRQAQQICYRALNKLHLACRRAGISAEDVLVRCDGNFASLERWA